VRLTAGRVRRREGHGEVAAMVSIMKSRLTPDSGVMPNDIRKDMNRAGYTDIATTLSLEHLTRKSLIEPRDIKDDGVDGTYIYTVYALTTSGLDWMLNNHHRFKLRYDEDNALKSPMISDEDIPF
jgi:hypothetical protein